MTDTVGQSPPAPNVQPNFSRAAYRGTELGIIETNRGCPYSCVFCDWIPLKKSAERLTTTPAL